MEISSEKEDALRTILGSHPIGISTDAIFSKCDEFDDRQDLARTLHLAKNQGWVHTKDGKHFLVTHAKDYDATAKPVEQVQPAKAVEVNMPTSVITEAAAASSPTTVPSPAFTSGDLRPSPLPFGDLSRSKSTGAAALALFKWRAEPALTLDEIVEITGVKKTVLYAVMGKLVDLEYVDKNDTDFRRPYFKWSGKFAYPFVKMLPTDNELLVYVTPLQLAQSKLPKIEVAAVKVDAAPKAVEASPDFKQAPIMDTRAMEVPVFREQSAEIASASGLAFKASNMELLVKQIDLELSHHRRQIEVLTAMRGLIVPTPQESLHV